MNIRKPLILIFSILLLVLLAVAPQTAFGNFRIIVLPDTQNESQYYPPMFISQTQWIVNNKSSIAFVAHVGDVVNTCTDPTQYDKADAAMELLDTGNVPYGVSPGNHDQTGYCAGDSLYPLNFGTPRFSGKPYYGGRLDNYNHYFLFSAGGMDFIIIFLQYAPGPTELAWADGRLAAYPDHRGIVVSHAILNVNNSWLTSGVQGEAIYNSLKSNQNLFLMLCGHMHVGSTWIRIRHIGALTRTPAVPMKAISPL